MNKAFWKRITFDICVIVVFFVIGCKTAKLPKLEDQRPPIEMFDDSTLGRIKYETAWIREYADLDNKNLELPQKMKKIIGSTQNINSLADMQDNQIKTLAENIVAIENSSDRQQKRIWLWVIALSAIMVTSGSVIAMLLQPKMGIGLGLSGIICFVTAYTMMQYAWLLGLIGMVFIVITVLMAIFAVVKYRLAIIELVTSFELVKYKSFDEVKEDIKTVQSPATKDLVKEVKKVLHMDHDKQSKTDITY